MIIVIILLYIVLLYGEIKNLIFSAVVLRKSRKVYVLIAVNAVHLQSSQNRSIFAVSCAACTA